MEGPLWRIQRNWQTGKFFCNTIYVWSNTAFFMVAHNCFVTLASTSFINWWVVVEYCLKMVIDFSASWCGPCGYMEPIVKEFSTTYTDVVFFKIDVDELAVCCLSYYKISDRKVHSTSITVILLGWHEYGIITTTLQNDSICHNLFLHTLSSTLRNHNMIHC